jgi:hypothetical protein
MAYINDSEILFSPIINIVEAPTLRQLATPSVNVSAGGRATWEVVTNAKEYQYNIYNSTTLVVTEVTTNRAVVLEGGQSITVMAVGDNISYTNSAWSAKKTHNAPVTIYYGVGLVTGLNITNEFVMGLTSQAQASRVCSFTVSPTKQYIYFAAPRSACIDSPDGIGKSATTFTINGFSGGFRTQQRLTVNGVDCYVYQSVQRLTGDVLVNVT